MKFFTRNCWRKILSTSLFLPYFKNIEWNLCLISVLALTACLPALVGQHVTQKFGVQRQLLKETENYLLRRTPQHFGSLDIVQAGLVLNCLSVDPAMHCLLVAYLKKLCFLTTQFHVYTILSWLYLIEQNSPLSGHTVVWDVFRVEVV